MPQRGIDTKLWYHSDFESISIPGKLLFIYLCTSPRGNQSGLYKITSKGISDDTGLMKSALPGLLDELKKMDIEWFPDQQIVWVKNFLKHQAHSPQFLIATARCLTEIHDNNLIKRYLDYNNTLTIPYQYPNDTLPPSVVSSQLSVVSSQKTDIRVDKPPKVSKQKYGKFQNVSLTSEEHNKLLTLLEDKGVKDIIERLSGYIASTGKKYTSHYATILNWNRKDNKENSHGNTNSRIPEHYTTPEEYLADMERRHAAQG